MEEKPQLLQLPGVQILRATDCVLVIRYEDQLNVTLQLAQQITNEVRQHFNKTQLGVVHCAGKLTTLDPGVREYIESNNRYEHKVAEAFVVKNLGQRILANFYLRIKRPVCPTEVFTSEEEAVKWVKMYCCKTPENKFADAQQNGSAPAILAN